MVGVRACELCAYVSEGEREREGIIEREREGIIYLPPLNLALPNCCAEKLHAAPREGEGSEREVGPAQGSAPELMHTRTHIHTHTHTHTRTNTHKHHK